jgi:tetracycline repressor-like protein
MIEEAPVSPELLDAIDRHGRLRTAQVRDVIVRHPDSHVGDPDVAAEIVLFTVEVNTHKFMADPRTVPVETFENELVAMVTRYLRGDR